jgi:hypothetical protein
MSFLAWLDGTWIAALVRETYYGYPAFEAVHAIGMAMMIGAIGVINLRVLGYKPQIPMLGVRQLLPLAWLGFAANAITGAALFTSDAFYFFESTTFRIKILLIFLAGINAWLLGRLYFREVLAGYDPAPTAAVKWIAATSLLFWFGALIAGRLLAYTP